MRTSAIIQSRDHRFSNSWNTRQNIFGSKCQVKFASKLYITKTLSDNHNNYHFLDGKQICWFFQVQLSSRCRHHCKTSGNNLVQMCMGLLPIKSVDASLLIPRLAFWLTLSMQLIRPWPTLAQSIVFWESGSSLFFQHVQCPGLTG